MYVNDKEKCLPPGAVWHKCTRCKRKYWHFTKSASICDKPLCYERDKLK